MKVETKQVGQEFTGVLEVVIPYTDKELAGAALRHTAMCGDLNVHVSLIAMQVVPFPCPLDRPPIDKDFAICQMRDLFMQNGLSGDAEILYTRDQLDGFQRLLDPQSLVVLASKRTWWPTREKRLARALSRIGHQVMLLTV